MDKEVAIAINHIYKSFDIPENKMNSIKQIFVSAGRGLRRKRQDVLKDINFDIYKGEFIGIVGRNGCGKSTLLKLLAGVYSPDSGSVDVKGSLTPFIELGVGFNPELSGRDNVFLNGALLGFTRKEMEAMYEDIVDFAELQGAMTKKLKNYSSGMQVRLAFSIAIRANSDILLLDEVLAVGDAAFQQKCYNYFVQLRQQRQTVVFVSHDRTAVERFCDRAVLLEDGVIVADGDPKAIYEEYFKDEHIVSEEEPEDPIGREVEANIAKISKVTTLGKGGKPQKVFTPMDESVALRLEVDAIGHATSPVYGFVIRKKGEEAPVTLSNTRVEGVVAPDIRAGDLVEVDFMVRNVFANGRYTVSALMAETRPGGVYYDWKDDIATFDVKARDFDYVPLYLTEGVKINTRTTR